MRVTDENLVASYKRTGNIWKTAEEVGICGQSVHERLTKLGVIRKMNLWTEADDEVLLAEYARHKKENTLEELARSLGRTKQFICRKARALGLTKTKERVMAEKAKAKLSESMKKWLSENGHPKGYLGHKHGDETRKKLSEKCHAAWVNPDSYVNSDEFRQKMSDAQHKRMMLGGVDVYSRCGKYPCVIGGMYNVFKSSWEVVIAKRLQELVDDGSITYWRYESKHFNFDDVKRGIRSYCPDFEVALNDGSVLFIEVKGWRMEKSMKRISMFKERYPDVKFYMIDNDEYNKILSESDYLRRRCV